MNKPIKKKTAVTRKSLAAKPMRQKEAKARGRWSWTKTLAIANIIGFISTLVVNYLANSLPIWGINTGQLSDLYPNLFTPAAITFSIRGVIYLGLLGFIIRQAMDAFKKRSTWITEHIGIRFLLSCAANIGRIFARHHQQVLLSVIIIIAFLITVIMLVRRAKVGQRIGTVRDKRLVQVPFSIYLGRLLVAVIANITAWMVNMGVPQDLRWISGQGWTMIKIIIASFLAVFILFKRNNVPLGLVVIRALIGIIIKRSWVTEFPIYPSIIWTAWLCIMAIAAVIGWRWEKRLKN